MFEPSGGAKNNLKKMKKVAILSLFILVGCVKKAEKIEVRGNYNVELLFENDGCKVYRFYDGRYIYYTDCSGKTSYKSGNKNGTTIVENHTDR